MCKISKKIRNCTSLIFAAFLINNSESNSIAFSLPTVRFRGYIKALMSSVRLVCCEPRRLFRRSNSKSSLDIGVVPVDRGVIKMELHHYTNNVRMKRNFHRTPYGERKLLLPFGGFFYGKLQLLGYFCISGIQNEKVIKPISVIGGFPVSNWNRESREMGTLVLRCLDAFKNPENRKA